MPFVHAVGVGCAPLTTQMSSTHLPHADNFHIMLVLAMDTELRPRSSHNVGVGCDPLTTQLLAELWPRSSHYVGVGCESLTTQISLTTHMQFCWWWIRNSNHAVITQLWPRSSNAVVLNTDLWAQFSLTTQFWLCWCWIRNYDYTDYAVLILFGVV